jgi:hypothetical protein
MGNLQGTYKFLNLTTGKKVKRRLFTAYPMPDSIVKKVNGMGQLVVPGALDFADRSSVLFKWNKDVDENPEGTVKEDMIPYPSLVAEFPGVTLDRNHPVPSIEGKIPPQGHAEDAVA